MTDHHKRLLYYSLLPCTHYSVPAWWEMLKSNFSVLHILFFFSIKPFNSLDLYNVIFSVLIFIDAHFEITMFFYPKLIHFMQKCLYRHNDSLIFLVLF